MLEDPQNENRCERMIADMKKKNSKKRPVNMEKKNSETPLVQKSKTKLRVRRTILKKDKHKDIVGQTIGPKGLNLRANKSVHVAKINETNHPDPTRPLMLGDHVYWACNACAFNVSQKCLQCESFITTMNDPDFTVAELDLEEFEVLKCHDVLHGLSIGPPTPGKDGINLNLQYQIQAVGLSKELTASRL